MLFPVIGLQLIVGQVFIQRHFQLVTQQMAESVVLEINYAIQLIDLAENNDTAQAALDEISVNLEVLLLLNQNTVMPTKNLRYFFDVSGKALIGSLTQDIALPLFVDLREDQNRVAIWVDTPKGILEILLPRSRVTASNPHQLLVLMILASTVLVVISVGFLRIQVRPLKRLAEAAEAFGKGQNMSLHPSGSTEIRRATLAFLSMRNKLDRHMEQRTQMLSGVSHDLRTPLTRMKLALEFMDGTEGLDKDVTDMERMLNGFLAFAKDNQTEKGSLTDPMDLGLTLVENMHENGGLVEFKAVFETYNRTKVILKPESMKRALQNLLDNAVKYGGNALLTVVLKDKFLEFCVEDSGQGIPEDKRSLALQPFERLDDSRNADGSVGLGLSIATDVARAHGGNLELLHSNALGGLCARIIIPR